MSLTNDSSNISLEIHKKQYNEVDLISSNPRKLAYESNAEINSQNKSSKKSENVPTDLVFGVPIYNHKPRKLGSVKAFCYIKGFPLIIIGPDCK